MFFYPPPPPRSEFSFSLVVLKIFTSEFYPIGALLACYGVAVLLVAAYRRYEGNRQFFDSWEEESSGGSGPSSSSSTGEEDEQGARVSGLSRAGTMVVKKKFRTSGNSVGLLVGLSLMSYAALMVLLWRIGS